MYGPLANILLSCYGVGMEQIFHGMVRAVWAPGLGHPAREIREVTVASGKESFDDISFYVLQEDCHWQVGDKVEIVLRKKTKETP